MASILVVDDEPEVGAAVRRVLERQGFDVVVADSAVQALEHVASAAPDILVTDVIMPQVHGLELIRSLRKDYPRIRVIAISGGGHVGRLGYKPDAISTHAYLAAAREAGAEEVLTKPFDMADLLGAIRKLLPN